jgi:hypothetical protein
MSNIDSYPETTLVESLRELKDVYVDAVTAPSPKTATTWCGHSSTSTATSRWR